MGEAAVACRLCTDLCLDALCHECGWATHRDGGPRLLLPSACRLSHCTSRAEALSTCACDQTQEVFGLGDRD